MDDVPWDLQQFFLILILARILVSTGFIGLWRKSGNVIPLFSAIFIILWDITYTLLWYLDTFTLLFLGAPFGPGDVTGIATICAGVGWIAAGVSACDGELYQRGRCVNLMALEKVTDRVYADVTGENGGNYGAIVLDEEIIMVDSGMIHLKSAVSKDYLSGKFGLPITKILLTHHHSDHVFGAQAFEPMSFISSSKTREICVDALESTWSDEELQAWAEENKETRPALWESIQTLRIIIPDVTFDEELRFGKDIVFRHIGGHTAGSSIVIVEPEHVLFIGDLLFNKSFPYAGDSSCNPDRWISGLEEIVANEYEIIIPGHGPLCGSEGITEEIEFLKKFRDLIKEALDEGLTFEQFIDENRTPDYYLEGAEHRVRVSVQHWFSFYGG